MVRRLAAIGAALAACHRDAPPLPPGPPTAAQLLARIATCDPIGGPFATKPGVAPTVSICKLPGAVSWTADLDVDCDGKVTTRCRSDNRKTAATDAAGHPLDAAALPYVVVPAPSARFDYLAAGLAPGSVFAVVYKDRVEYGVLGDAGPPALIGEASYRMAELLGIDPNPVTGGTADEVAYIGFTNSVISPIDDHQRAVTIGVIRAAVLLATPRSW